MSEIWNEVGGPEFIRPIKGDGFRLVEYQETVATTEIVSTLEKQSVLEDMLDQISKPPYHPGTGHLHYLLSTPFRYPPLAYGSRFGGRFESSLFYSGTSEYVTLCESAYYRFFFYHDMEVSPPSGLLQTQHTIFSFRYKTDSGIKLQSPPFNKKEHILRHPADYKSTQALGRAMRDDGIKGFEYCSARDLNGGINVAFYDATPLTSIKPHNKRACLCQTTSLEVVFSLDREITRFALEQFLVNGSLPRPPG